MCELLTKICVYFLTHAKLFKWQFVWCIHIRNIYKITRSAELLVFALHNCKINNNKNGYL